MVQKNLQPYWSFRDEMAIIDSIVMKGRRIIIPAVLQNQQLKHLLLKTRLLICKTICGVNMNADIEEIVKESAGTDMFTINNKNYLCILDYLSQFPVVKQVEGFSADNLTKPLSKVNFSVYGLPS